MTFELNHGSKSAAAQVHVLLRRMRFRSIFVLQESVAAGFGSGIATGCIVDLGHQTTSVTCIEDGYSLPGMPPLSNGAYRC